MRAILSAAAIVLTVFLGKPVRPGLIPGDRLIANLTVRLKKEPRNAALYYLIGRAHYATFSRAVESAWVKPGEVEVFGATGDNPAFYSIQGNIYPWDSKSAVRDTPDNRRHVAGAVRNLRMALDLATKSNTFDDPALAHLTLACAFDSGALLAPKVPLAPPYDHLTTKSQWRAVAANEYLLAFQEAIVKDGKLEHQPIFGLETLVAFEAGQSYLRLQPHAKESIAVRAGMDRLKKLPHSDMVTPLILDLTDSKPLSSLLEPAHQVAFDLDGSGRPQTYGWVKPTTAFLVWDPQWEGSIRSGRQLFGNATWWMLWPNAYSAIDALDDNHDGWLTGNELHGLALWYDRNGNGRCDPGEVVPIEQTPISALRTSFDGREGNSFVSTKGVLLKDGRVLPTYDWVTQSYVGIHTK